ncbi:MAG TPA: nucleotidyl transferase AbiEii/AbiGii toxin family protein [Tepidisphaeraceae bacterium]|nr:nucleotidyl transferase AbiEii/AbiGii toxin family protein [Tepidisphaeraceae bacterium]
MPNDDDLPEWERVLSAAARLQQILPEAVLVGGTAAAVHARHRLSRDADHVLTDLRERFDRVLAELESVAGWQTARVRRPVLILGSLDGIETGIRQLIREAPLDVEKMAIGPQIVQVPTAAEMLRIKAALILKRNATRDYIDFVALADRLGPERSREAMSVLDDLYPQPNGESALQQLQAQLANPLPYDLAETDLSQYKHLELRWHDWTAVRSTLAAIAVSLLDQL